MLRFKVLASVVPVVAVALFARGELLPGSHPCIAIANTSVEIASLPWHADLHVAFTDDPKLATVRVAVTDNADAADFAVIDDVDTDEDNACEPTPATQFIAISAKPSVAAPVIYLSRDKDDEATADYRIFVRSQHFTVREAAALIVGAHGQPPRLAAAAL